MATPPRSKQVRQTIRSLSREIKLAIKEANQAAAKRLARGDYGGAQSLMDMAKAISEFNAEVKALARRWNGIRSHGQEGKERSSRTPEWELYRPILQALVSLGGDATRKDIEDKLEETVGSNFKAGDLATNSRGMPRWKVMVGRSRKHMIEQGFVSGENLLRWKITGKGEQAAKSGIKGK